MTDKTIINGIDVSECIDFIYPIDCNSKNTKSIECKENPNCYFKQLARAKEETSFLKFTINNLAEQLGIEKPNYTINKDFADFQTKLENKIECLQTQTDYWKNVSMIDSQECERITEMFNEITKEFQIECLEELPTGKRTYRSLMLLEYEQVLDEIKRDITSTCENCKQTYYNQHCEECNKGYILNIINKAKGEQ